MNKIKEVSKNEYELNPLSWGILFFTFWISLIILPIELNIAQKILAWFCFGFSVVLWISIWIPKLRNQFNRPKIKRSILPVIFEITIAGFIVGFVSSLSSIDESLRSVVIYFGFIWVVTYLLILVRASMKGIGIIGSLAFIIYGIILASYASNNPVMISGIVSVLIGIACGYVSIMRPKWLWHKSLI